MPGSHRRALYPCHTDSLLRWVVDGTAADANRLDAEDRALRREALCRPASAWRAGVGGDELFLAATPGPRS